MRKIMASLDIGSDKIKLVVGEMIKTKLNILAVSTTPSKGIKNGVVVNEANLIDCLKKVIKKEEEILGLKVNQVILSIPNIQTEFIVSEGTANILSDDNVIRGREIVNVIQDAVNNKIQSNMELINVLPTSYKIDDDKITNDPIGMIGQKLMVKCVLVTMPKLVVYPLVDAVRKAGVEVIDISIGALGDYHAFRNNKLDEEIGVIVNMGESQTTLSVINKGVLTNTKSLDVGGANIDNDIMFIYKINKEAAKVLKETLALAHKRLAVASDYEKVVNRLNEEVKINQYELSEIVMSRLNDALLLAKKQINHLTKKEISYIIFTGGLTELIDFPIILGETFGKNVILGRIKEIGVRDNAYSTSVGLIKYYCDKMNKRDKDYSIFTMEEQKELSGIHKRVNVNESSLLGKLFGYFFDN